MNRFIIVAIFSLATLPALTQTHTFSGILATQGKREPLIGISIQIRSTTAPQQRFSARSSKSGSFTIASVPHGDYDVSVRAIGYKPFSKRFRNDERIIE